MAADDEVRIDFDDLTLGDMEEIETITGESMTTIFAAAKEGSLSVKAISALIFVTKRRDDPGFTLEAARGIRLTDLSLEFGKPGKGDQTVPADPTPLRAASGAP